MKKAMIVAFYSGVILVIIGVFLNVEDTGLALIINGVIVLCVGILSLYVIKINEDNGVW